MSSFSASGRSKGARFVSAMMAIMKMIAETNPNGVKMNQFCSQGTSPQSGFSCSETISVIRILPTARAMQATDIAMASS